MTDKFYHYTTLEALSMILSSRKIRFTPLHKLDDLQESVTKDALDFAKFVFISSWMNERKESISMWKLYSNMNSGVRIGLKRNPFRTYPLSEAEARKYILDIKVETGIDLIVPPSECFSKRYFVTTLFPEKLLERVVYTDDETILNPQIIQVGDKGVTMQMGELGKYKNTYWEFQNEERYILKFVPIDISEIAQSDNAAQKVYDAYAITSSFLDYYYLYIDDSAFGDMEITTSPSFTVGNEIMLEALREKYNPSMIVRPSDLRGRLLLK